MKTKYFYRAGIRLHYIPKKVYSFLILMLCIMAGSFSLSAQILPSTNPEKDETRKGNRQFTRENYPDAEASYKKALDKKNNMPEAVFNLGDAVYKQKRYGEATQQFELSSKTNPDPKIKAKALHNLGNTYLEQKKWEEAVRSYKNALRWNPNDRDTKYNLAYANAMLRQSANNSKQNNKNQDKKDKKDDKKDQQNKDNKDQKPDQKQDQQQANKDQQKQGPKPKLSKEDAEKLLQALNSEEQKTNQKVQQKQVKVVNVKILKDW